MKTDHYLETGQMSNFLEVYGSELPQAIRTVLRSRQLGPNGTGLGVRLCRTGMCFEHRYREQRRDGWI